MTAVQAPVVTTARHRVAVDGQGITTLVCFHGCPLRCKWCLNPFTWDPKTPYQLMTPEQLYEKVRKDDLYFRATGGGVTFGGGEPLLQSDFIRQFCDLCGDGWHLCAETSLWVPWENVETAARCVDIFYVDCKDTNPEIYRSYTGRDNGLMLENLKGLLAMVGSERIIVRLPLIPEYNTEQDQQKSKVLLTQLGITQFDLFTYQVRKNDR